MKHLPARLPSFVLFLSAPAFSAAIAGTAPCWRALPGPARRPIVLTGADRRAATSLDGDWASIVDPYFSGLFSFHHEMKKNGYLLNRKAQARR